MQLECAVCQTPFQHEKHGPGRLPRFCSLQCRAVQRSQQKAACLGRLSEGDRRNRYPATRQPKPLVHCQCEQCGVSYQAATGSRGNRFCNSQCRDAWHVATKASETAAKLRPVECPCCSTVFKPKQSLQRYCTRRCEKKVQHSNKNHRRRAATEAGTVNPYAVFTRDGWQCKSCSKPTPRSQRGTFDHDAPELDHIVPISKGGPHTYANTQCLCRACNQSKGAKLSA